MKLLIMLTVIFGLAALFLLAADILLLACLREAYRENRDLSEPLTPPSVVMPNEGATE